MYFNDFDKILYNFVINGKEELKVMTDITKNVRVRKEILSNITLFDTYIIQEGETPEIIAEKVYGRADYHWSILLANDRYDYLNDYLVEIENRYRTKELFEKAENKDLLKKKVIDYFILCSEEFFWYHHKNRIDNTIWDSWEQGMNYWFNEVEVIKDIWIEEIAKNGKKSYYILDDGVEFFKNKQT